MILGVVLAGGKSTRFGSDKALANWNGQTLLERATEQLARCCQKVVISGREHGLEDWPRQGMGPLAGIAAALRMAQDQGFQAVLSCGVDMPDLPNDLLALLSPAPTCCASQPVLGLWPLTALPALEEILRSQGRHSLRAFAEACGARQVHFPTAPANINTPADLAAALQEDRHH